MGIKPFIQTHEGSSLPVENAVFNALAISAGMEGEDWIEILKYGQKEFGPNGRVGVIKFLYSNLSEKLEYVELLEEVDVTEGFSGVELN